MYDGSFDLYDHMLHFNQAMILNVGDDRLLCKVFRASLKGPTLAWFYKLLRGSINLFSELWAAFVSQYMCLVRQKGNTGSKLFSSERTSPSAISPEDLEGLSNRLILIAWIRSSRISEGTLDRPHYFSTRYLRIRLRQGKNCTEGRINIQRWRIISGQPPKS